VVRLEPRVARVLEAKRWAQLWHGSLRDAL